MLQAEDGTASRQAVRPRLLAAWQICPAAICFFSSIPARAVCGSIIAVTYGSICAAPDPSRWARRSYWSIAPGYYDAIAAYYQGLLHAGVIHKSQPSAKKIAAALTPQFCAWGAQVERNKGGEHQDEAFVTGIFAELKASGLKAGMLSIDDKWEGSYGNLEHSADRLPHFEQFLDKVHEEGYLVGLWAALMRCEHPAEMGLTTDQMLKKPNGQPFVVGGDGPTKVYVTGLYLNPQVAAVLQDVARKFIRRYKPDLLKFDFGYEMPSVATAAPRDKKFTGERLMWKGLDVLITAMRKENPDLVVMYYNLSPLFLDYFDLFSPDDLFENAGEYAMLKPIAASFSAVFWASWEFLPTAPRDTTGRPPPISGLTPPRWERLAR